MASKGKAAQPSSLNEGGRAKERKRCSLKKRPAASQEEVHICFDGMGEVHICFFDGDNFFQVYPHV